MIRGVKAMPSHGSLDGYTGFLLRKISHATFSRFSATCATHDLHPMHFGMLTILAAEAPISQRALSDRTGVDPSTMVQRMDVLERQGLVERVRAEGDRRSYEITLTAAGRQVLEQLRKDAAVHAEAVFGVLEPAEREQLHRLLTKVADHLDGASGT